MKFYTSAYTYDYSFPAVSLAYFLRYPNPYSTHVLSEDVISRHFEPETQRLYTTRLHLKQSKIPSWILNLLPRNILGNNRGPNGEAQNFILEKSVVDVREGWMETESQNLQYTGVLKVIEKQRFARVRHESDPAAEARSPEGHEASQRKGHSKQETTDVSATVTFVSRFGQNKRKFEALSSTGEAEEPRKGFFSWSTAKLQGSIEGASLERARKSLVKSKDGMNVVLERMREGGLAAVLEGMRRDRELVFGADRVGDVGFVKSIPKTNESLWKKIWDDATDSDEGFDV